LSTKAAIAPGTVAKYTQKVARRFHTKNETYTTRLKCLLFSLDTISSAINNGTKAKRDTRPQCGNRNGIDKSTAERSDKPQTFAYMLLFLVICNLYYNKNAIFVRCSQMLCCCKDNKY
jgi:hypothetical protein